MYLTTITGSVNDQFVSDSLSGAIPNDTKGIRVTITEVLESLDGFEEVETIFEYEVLTEPDFYDTLNIY